MKELVKIKPMFNRIITTMNTYEEDQKVGSLIDSKKAKGSLKEYQTVLAVGDTVRGVKEGDVVCIDPTRYQITKHENKASLRKDIIGDEVVVGYKFNTITIDGKECMMLYDQDITFVILESRDTEPSPVIIEPEKPSIVTEL